MTVYFKPKAETFIRNAFAFGCIVVSTLLLPACQDDVTISTVERRKPATVYSPGTKITVVPADQSEGEIIPPSLLDPSKICSSVKFYNADGNIGYGEADCSGATVADLKPENIRAGVVVGEIVGTLSPEPASCSVDGETACVAIADFRAAQVDSIASKIAMGSTAAGIAGTFVGNFNACTADGEVGCLANGTFKAASIVGAAEKILMGQTIAGVSGNASLPPAGKVLTGTIYGPAGNAVGGSLTLPSAGDVRAGSGLYGESGTSVTPAYVADFPDVANVLGSDTVNGAAGTLTLPLAANVRTVNGTYGVGGSGTSPTLSTCGSDGDTGCVVIGPAYAAAIVTGAASRIVSGQSVAGVSGSFTAPAVGKVLTGTAYGIGGNGSTGTLTLPSAGNVLTGSGTYGDPGSALTPSYSPDFPSAGNVLSTDTVNGAAGTLTLPAVGNVLSTISFGVAGNGSTGTLTLPAAGKVLTATSYGVAGTGSTGTLTLPSAGNVLTGSGTYGDPGSALTPSYSPDFPSAGNVLSTDSVNGAAGTLTLPAVGKVLTGISYGVAGNGSTGTLTLPSASNVLTASGTYGDPGSAVTPSYSPDFPDVGHVLSADTVNGATGTLALPTISQVLTGISFGIGGNGSTGTLTLPAASNVRSSNGAYGVGGSGTTPTLADCIANNITDCVTTSSYKSASFTNITAGNIKSGVTLAGVVGDYPSATYRLAANTATTDLTLFITQLTTDGTFEFLGWLQQPDSNRLPLA
ncbi:MAG: hypothetical protein M3Q07_10765 [Pseudobdellovibrionaceae bacterium]|nr:hypothetical protein [Pseudobdellovibrionaceae bacterium]